MALLNTVLPASLDMSGSPRIPLSPEAQSLYQSQWLRYKRSLEIFPESVTVNLKTAESTARYLTSQPGKDANDPLFNNVTTLISDGQLQILRQRYREVTQDGDLVTFRGEYRNPKGIDPIQTDGSAIVQQENRLSLALIPASSNRIEIEEGSEEVVETLPKGTPGTYQCNCPDYGGRESLLKITSFGEINRRWGFLGKIGGCKHLLSFRQIIKDLPAVPNDLPMDWLEKAPTRSGSFESMPNMLNPKSGKKPRWV